jgi:hypothetical protein
MNPDTIVPPVGSYSNVVRVGSGDAAWVFLVAVVPV